MMLLQGSVAAARTTLCENAFSTIIKNSCPVLRPLHNSLAAVRCSSTRAPGIMTHGRMNVNTPPWVPFFAPVGDSSLPGVDQKCIIRIVSYNILAQAYVKSANFPTSPRSSLRWKNRSEAVLSRLLSLDADLLCLQEVDEFDTFYKEALRKEGYESVYIQRGNQKRDGCGIFFRHSKISLLADEVIDYNDLVPSLPEEEEEAQRGIIEDSSAKAAQKRGDMNDTRVRLQRDCVGIIAAFRPVTAPSRILVVANTHIFWDPVLMDVKLAQVRYLAKRLLAFQKRIAEEFEVEPLLFVVGDFNSLPGDTVYNYVTSGINRSVVEPENLDVSPVVGLSISQNQFAESGFGPADGEWIPELIGRFPLPLVSLYAYVDKEPPATNYTHNFVGTLDYIFFIPSKHLKPKSVLVLPPRDSPDVISGLPNNHHPSDHLPIGSDFEMY